MHPFAQRVLIEVLIKKFPDLQIFLTTHSNHFLDLTYDFPEYVTIFSFEKSEEAEKFHVKDLSDNTKILDLLGIRNSSVFLSNSVIWTEGVTDRMLLRKLFEINDSFKFKEDYHYTFSEYGGNNLENFDFVNGIGDESDVHVNSLSKTNYVIMDNDGIYDSSKPTVLKNPKYRRRQRVKSVLSEKNVFDSHVEIENLIPYKVWVKVIEKILKKQSGKKIKFKEKYNGKEEIFNKEIEKGKIGKVFKKYLIKEAEDKNVEYYKANNIQCLGLTKKEIMQYVIDVVDEEKISIEEFSETTKKLIDSLGKFIEGANKK